MAIPGRPLKRIGELLFKHALKATTAGGAIGVAGGLSAPIETGLPPMWNALANALMTAVLGWVGVYILPANRPTSE